MTRLQLSFSIGSTHTSARRMHLVVESDVSTGDDGELDLPQEYLIPDIDAEALSYFAPEAEEYVCTIQNLLQRLEGNLQDQELIHQLYRISHTLKGSAYTVGFQVVGDIAHPMETCHDCGAGTSCVHHSRMDSMPATGRVAHSYRSCGATPRISIN